MSWLSVTVDESGRRRRLIRVDEWGSQQFGADGQIVKRSPGHKVGQNVAGRMVGKKVLGVDSKVTDVVNNACGEFTPLFLEGE